MSQILFFGASSVEGVGDPEGGWVDRFKREFHAGIYGDRKYKRQDIYNLGVAGDTASQILERVPYELPARQKGAPSVVAINVGTNDSRAEDSPTNFASNPEEYMVALQNVVEYIKSYTPHIVFIGLTPIDDTRTRPIAEGRYYFTQARVQQFNAAMANVAQSYRLPMVELYNSMLALDWRAMLFDDGLHLNAVGHEWLYQRIRQPMLIALQEAERSQQQ